MSIIVPFFSNITISEKNEEKTEEDSIITEEEIQTIMKTKKALEAQNLVSGLGENGLYYVNKVEYLSELIMIIDVYPFFDQEEWENLP